MTGASDEYRDFDGLHDGVAIARTDVRADKDIVSEGRDAADYAYPGVVESGRGNKGVRHMRRMDTWVG